MKAKSYAKEMSISPASLSSLMRMNVFRKVNLMVIREFPVLSKGSTVTLLVHRKLSYISKIRVKNVESAPSLLLGNELHTRLHVYEHGLSTSSSSSTMKHNTGGDRKLNMNFVPSRYNWQRLLRTC